MSFLRWCPLAVMDVLRAYIPDRISTCAVSRHMLNPQAGYSRVGCSRRDLPYDHPRSSKQHDDGNELACQFLVRAVYTYSTQ